jgi:hypothetical protein
MTYKIVRNILGEVVCFGLNDGNYEPTIKVGEVLSIETNAIAEPLIKAFTNKAKLEAEAAATAKAALLARLGITADEAKLLLGGN